MVSQPPDGQRIASLLKKAEVVLNQFHAGNVPPGVIELPDARYHLFVGQSALMNNLPAEAEVAFAKGRQAARDNLRSIASPALLDLTLMCEVSLFELHLGQGRVPEARKDLEAMEELASNLTAPFAQANRDFFTVHNHLRRARLEKAAGMQQASDDAFANGVEGLLRLAVSPSSNFSLFNDLAVALLAGGRDFINSQPIKVVQWCEDALRLLESVPDPARNEVWKSQHEALKKLLVQGQEAGM